MRLLRLNSQGELKLTKDITPPPAAYAVLSHTWGSDDDEVTFDDIEKQTGKEKAGYAKLQFCANRAKKDGLEYFWVDTCCINKANFTELSEAIISMFQWYQNASKCYVYLSDVSVHSNTQSWVSVFRASRWFTRGWTLQELLAPSEVEFFSIEGAYLGDRKELEWLIQGTTGIPSVALQGADLASFSVDERMQWAANRQTKRVEDGAYCLLGIFGIFMPLIYGEGSNAIVRLQREIKVAAERSESQNTEAAPSSPSVPADPDSAWTVSGLAPATQLHQGHPLLLQTSLPYHQRTSRQPENSADGSQSQARTGTPQQSDGVHVEEGPPPPAYNESFYKRLLEDFVEEKGLRRFYRTRSSLNDIASRATQQVETLVRQWHIDIETASAVVKLALYRVILYIDDSGSMSFEQNGERINELKLILSRIAFATSLFNNDGFSIRFMNSTEPYDAIRSDWMANNLVARTKFSGLTPMAREMDNKILRPLVLGPVRSGTLKKPVLVITITDGQPSGEGLFDIARTISAAGDQLERYHYSQGTLALQFAQVGNDLFAQEFLTKLDEDPKIGHRINCVSSYELEEYKVRRGDPYATLTHELWLLRLLLGSIDSAFSNKPTTQSPPPGRSDGYGRPQAAYER